MRRLMMAGKDTRTRYQGVYARHRGGCALSVALYEGREGASCDCRPSYFGVVWDKQGGRTRKTRHFPTAGAARNARADMLASLRIGRPVGSSSLRFDAAVEKFLTAAREGTALTKHGQPYRTGALKDLTSLHHLPSHLRTRRLGDISRGDLQAAIDEWLQEGLSGSRIRARISAVRSLYRWAIQREFASENPAAVVALPALNSKPRDRVATPEEFSRLLVPLQPADQLPLALAAYASARAAEIRVLDWADVDLEKGLLALAEPGGKSAAAQRVIPAVRPLLALLKAAHLRQGRPTRGKVCPPMRTSKSGELATGQYLRRIRKEWADANRAARALARQEGGSPDPFEPINLHESRHTCATWLDHAGVSPKVASEWMGHAAPGRQPGAAPITLNRYTHVLAGELEVARDQLDAFLAQRAASLREVP